jgi:L-malate glycosyltransferase
VLDASEMANHCDAPHEAVTPGSDIRVLWTSNIVLPAVATELGVARTPFGGWLSLMTERLAAQPGFQVGIAMRSPLREYRALNKDGIAYFALPQRRLDRFDTHQKFCERALNAFKPDILHVEGAEMRFARRFLETWQGERILSMQGIINAIYRYELGRLPFGRFLSLSNPLLPLTYLSMVAQRFLEFAPRLKHERSSMRATEHILGRTLWDQAQAAALAPQAKYHHCSRILRPPFYNYRWSASGKEPHSLFLGNSASARKGAHVAIEAASLLVHEFPGLRIYIAGQNPALISPWSPKRHIGYPVYLSHLIRKLNLEERVSFTGILDSTQMADRMARSHACVISSIIENSPNTLGEAMLVGAPIVSAYAGGAPSMATDEQEALFYRADDPAMLAHQIRRIFKSPELAAKLSSAARQRAVLTHDPELNFQALASVYRAIMEPHRS